MNKKIIQILLVILLLLLSIFFFNKLFKSKKTEVSSIETSETTLKIKESHQNLKYEVNFENNKKYKITAKKVKLLKKMVLK